MASHSFRYPFLIRPRMAQTGFCVRGHSMVLSSTVSTHRPLASAFSKSKMQSSPTAHSFFSLPPQVCPSATVFTSSISASGCMG